MTSNFETMLQLIAKALPIALSFADDLLLFILVKLGVTIPGISWISPLLLTLSLLFYISRWVMKYHNSNSSQLASIN